MDLSAVENINAGTRERLSRGRKAARERHVKYRDKDPVLEYFQRPCNHTTSNAYKCAKIQEASIKQNRRLLYRNGGVCEQNVYLCRLIAPYQPMRRRMDQSTTTRKQKQCSCTYYLLKKKKPVPVCKKFFLAALSLGKRRVENLCKLIFDGKIPKENRGGDRKSHKSVAKKTSVINFIKKLNAKESHYNRNKSKRIYLASELNISKLCKMYNSTVSSVLRVKYAMFRKIFVTKFNIGFSSPASDICTYCVLIKNKIKQEANEFTKQKLITEARIHKLRSNAFYSIMKEDGHKELKFCFDLQQVNPLPRTPIQEAFYSRQISFYNFCVVGTDSKSPTFYCWSEEQSGRGATEIASALLNFLNSTNFTDISTLHLFADGCGGQNKNKHIVHTLVYWLSKNSPVNLKTIQLTFPVRGHSFLPADRVFGRLEKNVKRYPMLTLKKDYINIFQNHGTVKELGEPNGWQLYDIKQMTEIFNDIRGIQNLKRIKFRKTSQRSGGKCVVEVYDNYRGESIAGPTDIMKRGKSLARFTLRGLQLGHAIKPAKKKDVANLLEKQFGNNWQNLEELRWYVDLLKESNQQQNVELEESDEDPAIECICDEHDSEAIRI